jgi:RNA polymerase sigma-70 factor (ECF subfamily)
VYPGGGADALDPTSRSFSRILAFGADVGELHALRRGSEDAFRALVARHQASLLRVARSLVRDPSLAEEVVQQTWVEVIEGGFAFDGRSTIKTWLCGICINVARARLRQERRTTPLSSLGVGGEFAENAPAVDPARFYGPEAHWAGHWYVFPAAWPATPEDGARGSELRARLIAAIDELPTAQREVLVLRDVEGFSGEEVCNVLGLSDTNQRVLLHRARSRLRGLLEDFLDPSRSS